MKSDWCYTYVDMIHDQSSFKKETTNISHT